MEIEIRPAYDEIQKIKGLFAEYTQSLGVNLDFQDYAKELEQLPGRYNFPEGRLYIALADGQPAGCVAMRKIDAAFCEMKRLYVKCEFRGQKMGKMLANQIIQDAIELEYEFMLLDTFGSLKSAVKLYERLGFYEIDPYYDNPLENVVYMQLELKSYSGQCLQYPADSIDNYR